MKTTTTMPLDRPRPGTPLRVTELTTEDELRRLGPVWDRLIEESGLDNPFLTHACILSAWESFGDGNRLQILVVSDEAGPVAIAPFMIGPERLFGLRLRRVGDRKSTRLNSS